MLDQQAHRELEKDHRGTDKYSINLYICIAATPANRTDQHNVSALGLLDKAAPIRFQDKDLHREE